MSKDELRIIKPRYDFFMPAVPTRVDLMLLRVLHGMRHPAVALNVFFLNGKQSGSLLMGDFLLN